MTHATSACPTGFVKESRSLKSTVPNQKRSKSDFGNNVLLEATFKIRDNLFVYRSQLAAVASGAANGMATC